MILYGMAALKIVAGLSGAADVALVREFIAAGADEFFCGYVPAAWSREFGYEFSPNRRYRRANQITSRTALAAVCGAAAAQGRPVSVAFNEHLVTQRAWRQGRLLLREAVEAGVRAVIVADPAIIRVVKSEFPSLAVHVSGDAGACNAASADLFFTLGADRLIFPRELGWRDLKSSLAELRGPRREFEAFIMGEPCVFDGARCFTEHGYDLGRDFCSAHLVKSLYRRGGKSPECLVPEQEKFLRQYRARKPWAVGKCGLCAIRSLARLGVTHLKIPGRASNALAAVRLVRRMVDSGAGPVQARGLMAVPDLCDSRLLCYYPESGHG